MTRCANKRHRGSDTRKGKRPPTEAASKAEMHFRRSASRMLICKSVNDELKRVRRFDAGGINLFLDRRIQKCLCLLGAIEFDYDQALRWRSIYGGEFYAANDVLTAGSLKVFWLRFIANAGLKSGSVVYFQNGNDNISWRLGLGMESLDGSSSMAAPATSAIAPLYFFFFVPSLID